MMRLLGGVRRSGRGSRRGLLEQFPTLDANQYTAKGYGESRPLAPGNDKASWALNRRVEFVVLNKDVLKHEVEKHRLQTKDAPADTTGH